MKSRVLASAGVFLTTVVLSILGTGVANAAPVTTQSVTAAAATNTLMKDCKVANGVDQGCTYFNPADNVFRACDYGGDPRHTYGRLSVNGVRIRNWDVFASDGYSASERFCLFETIPGIGAGDRVCIHTGVTGLGWTTPECQDLR